MAQIKSITKKLLVIIITISLLISFVVTPSAQAKLTLEDGEFYYSGTTKGTYKARTSIFAWLLNSIGDIADWLLGIMTMGFRMVFVGWTALIEKILTWSLEGTAGVNVDGENVSATDISSISDSSNNITVQAIVYNQVPALDINFFDSSIDKGYSGTGKKLHCQKCDQDVEVCCSSTGCSCKCKGNCDDCRRYIAALNVTTDPVIIQIKNVISTWYYIMRYLCIAALLIVLLGVGIKMALSTIASEKAVYKRMLVDWVVGAIIVFSIHYIMIFVIYLNETLVNTVKESSNNINKVSMMQLAEKNDEVLEYTNEELEIDIYEAVRTRAYDPKLINGMTGMVMYMTLVYFAIRYTIVYLKRLLTLIVLTLMAPAVGVSYALQKVFSGKAGSLSSWMTEYIMNVFIQVIHAIIYAVFISTALVMSLQSLSGIILAFIIMNYSLKVESTFRKIFKKGNSGKLSDDTASSGDADKIKQNLDATKGLVLGAKPMAKAIMNSPYGSALKAVGKIGAAAGIGAAAAGAKVGSKAVGAIQKHREETAGQRYEKAVDKEMERMYGSSEAYTNSQGEFTETDQEYEDRRNAAKESLAERNPKKYGTKVEPKDSGEAIDPAELDALFKKGEQGLRQDIISALSNQDKAAVDVALDNYGKFKNHGGGITQGKIALAHAKNLVDIENHFVTKRNPDGSLGISKFAALRKTVLGTKHYDPMARKYVSDNNGLYTQLSAEKLLGLTAADKKILKQEVLTPLRNGLGGMAAMFVGMGTIVAHPKLGMGLLAGGYSATKKTFKKKIDPTAYNGTYSFARFGTQTVKKMQKEAIKRARKEWDGAVAQNVKENHPELYKKIQHDLGLSSKLKDQAIDLAQATGLSLSVGTVGLIGGVMPQFVPLVTIAGAGFVAKKLIGHTGLKDNLDRVNQHSAKQLREQQLAFINDGMILQAGIQEEVFRTEYENNVQQMYAEEMKKRGFEYDAEKGDWVEKKNVFKNLLEISKNLAEEFKKNKEQYDQEMIERCKQLGLEYDPKTGMTKSIDGKEKTTVAIESSDIDKSVLGENGQKNEEKAINEIKKEIDREIEIQLMSMNDFDINSEAVQKMIIDKLDSRLKQSKLIAENTSVEKVFNKESGKDFKSLLKTRALTIQANAEASETALKGFDPAVQDVIKQAVFEIKKANNEIGHDEPISLKDVMSKMVQIEKRTAESPATGDTKDGSKAVDSKNDGSLRITDRDGIVKLSMTEQVQIQEFITNLQSREQPRKVTQEKKYKEIVENRKAEAISATVSRKSKLDQVLNLSLNDEQFDTTVDQIKAGEKVAQTGDVISSDDSQAVLNLLFMRKEIEGINQFVIEELKPKSGPKEYMDANKAESKAKVNYYDKKIEYDHAVLEQKRKQALDLEVGKLNDSEKKDDITTLLEALNQSKAEWEQAKNDKYVKGPIINVSDLVSGVTTDVITSKPRERIREVVPPVRETRRIQKQARKQAKKQAKKQSDSGANTVIGDLENLKKNNKV